MVRVPSSCPAVMGALTTSCFRVTLLRMSSSLASLGRKASTLWAGYSITVSVCLDRATGWRYSSSVAATWRMEKLLYAQLYSLADSEKLSTVAPFPLQPSTTATRRRPLRLAEDTRQ